MKTRELITIYNVLFNVDKGKITDNEVRRAMVENVIAISPIAEQFNKDQDNARKQ